jgi:hypothetical protein
VKRWRLRSLEGLGHTSGAPALERSPGAGVFQPPDACLEPVCRYTGVVEALVGTDWLRDDYVSPAKGETEAMSLAHLSAGRPLQARACAVESQPVAQARLCRQGQWFSNGLLGNKLMGMKYLTANSIGSAVADPCKLVGSTRALTLRVPGGAT